MTRTVGGQFPKGFDPVKWGIPASMVGDVDKIALWNIVTTVDAYLSAGFTPAEILEAVHPSMVASTQGTGFGGMASMRKLYLDRFLNHEIPTDILQEALPNVVAAHVMQSYIGGYGNMIQPVSACATAAVSLEEGADKIALGKADFVVTGAIDDIGVESVIGFGNMNATANSEEMYAKGIDARFFSRANDRRRGGFVESQGGGTILLTRGDIALKLGLPVAGVVGFVHSYADGAHTSIPAPGLGALAAGTLKSAQTVSIGKDVWKNLNKADDLVSEADGTVDGWALSTQGRSVLRQATDNNGRPLFLNGTAASDVSTVLGNRTYISKGVHVPAVSETPGPAKAEILGVCGEFSSAAWGSVEGMQTSISDQASITIDGKQVNLWEHNMFAVRIEIEVGFRIRDINRFVLLTA